MQALLDITKVTATENHQLVLKFENGENRIFDMNPYLLKRPFGPLKDIALFKLARVENGMVSWPGDIDISPDTLYDKSVSGPNE